MQFESLPCLIQNIFFQLVLDCPLKYVFFSIFQLLNCIVLNVVPGKTGKI